MFKKNKNVAAASESEIINEKISFDFKFFKCCSATLKKFSVIMFIANLFITIVAAAVGIVLIGVYIGTQMMSILLVPILCVVAIFVLVARLISAFIYGFGEIVEKYENK